MSAAIMAIAAPGSQSTVFITTVSDGLGEFTTATGGGSLTGRVFGLELTRVYSDGGTFFEVDATGSASGQSFFRQLIVSGSGSATLNSSAATYNSANNTWSWGTFTPGAGTFTLRFLR